jgi:hypothetical protein
MRDWSGAPRSPQAAEIIRLAEFDKRGDPNELYPIRVTRRPNGDHHRRRQRHWRVLCPRFCRERFLDLQRETGAALADSLDECAARPLFVPCDLTDTATLRAALGEISAALGPAAVLVNNTVLFAVLCSGADGSCARLRFRAAIKSITGDGVDTARGSKRRPEIIALRKSQTERTPPLPITFSVKTAVAEQPFYSSFGSRHIANGTCPHDELFSRR